MQIRIVGSKKWLYYCYNESKEENLLTWEYFFDISTLFVVENWRVLYVRYSGMADLVLIICHMVIICWSFLNGLDWHDLKESVNPWTVDKR